MHARFNELVSYVWNKRILVFVVHTQMSALSEATRVCNDNASEGRATQTTE